MIPALLKYRYLILGAVLTIPLSAHISSPGTDWSYLVQGAEQFGLDLFKRYPQIQMGPVPLLVTLLIGTSALIGKLLIAGLGVGCVVVMERAGLRLGRNEQTVKLGTLIGGTAVIYVWDQLTATGHLDDALALTGISLCIWLTAARHPVLGGVAMGLAIASKPWAIMAAPLLLTGGVRAVGAGLGVMMLAWGPFVIFYPETLRAAKFAILVAEDSGLKVLGWDGIRAPEWQRPVQFATGLALATLTILRNAWPITFAAAMLTRAALDAGTYDYYEVGIVLGALCWDVLGSRLPVPVATVGMFLVTLDPTRVIARTGSRGWVLFILIGALVVLTYFRALSPPQASSAAKS